MQLEAAAELYAFHLKCCFSVSDKISIFSHVDIDATGGITQMTKYG